MNYISHLKAFYEKLANDDRFNSSHVSLYLALFQCWNRNHFENPLSVNRKEILLFSKIGSNHTYYRTLKDLADWGYIQYEPSFSPIKGSLINLCIFAQVTPENDTKNEHELCKNDIGSCAKMHHDGCKIDIATCAKMHPSLNNININNKTLSGEQSQNENQIFYSENLKIQYPIIQNLKRKKLALKKEMTFVPPTLDEVFIFFKSESAPEIEAKKFFNHFESNGWKVGGKTPMKNWNAAARNWMLNSQRFSTYHNNHGPQQKIKPNPNNKNYSEPL